MIVTQDRIETTTLLQGFKAIADPIRLEILERLRTQELCVCELCDVLGLKQSKLSFHLKILKESELVLTRQDGRWIYYRLNLAQFIALETYLATYRRFGEILPARPCPD
ncbi:arsenical resistance operon repressor, ArsR family [[Synechococcus] sp. NIES-970]|uniref:ArsR/SmtB family transcription factor n=1 Tax=Picosynechococcus sp. NKBG15041c TaxID=1407650 RepID=UPI000411327D|nr:metalloregulator ArsR/SmtB family transcription factor [Picosynechococcus sp. NKBG15041c]BAW95754.1 arsenical resistance operon repressor, ArsR family [[Synechococcus] sp. NIES-970]